MLIEELEKMLKEATPGPWRYHDDFLHIDTEDEVVNTQNENNYDGQLICLLRNNAEKLLAVVKHAQQICEESYFEDEKGKGYYDFSDVDHSIIYALNDLGIDPSLYKKSLQNMEKK